MKATIKNLMQLAGLQKAGGHMVTYTCLPSTNEVVFFYVSTVDFTNENSFVAWHGLPDGCIAPSQDELETALSVWLKTHTPEQYKIENCYQRMRDNLAENIAISKGLEAGQDLETVIKSLIK